MDKYFYESKRYSGIFDDTKITINNDLLTDYLNFLRHGPENYREYDDFDVVADVPYKEVTNRRGGNIMRIKDKDGISQSYFIEACKSKLLVNFSHFRTAPIAENEFLSTFVEDSASSGDKFHIFLDREFFDLDVKVSDDNNQDPRNNLLEDYIHPLQRLSHNKVIIHIPYAYKVSLELNELFNEWDFIENCDGKYKIIYESCTTRGGMLYFKTKEIFGYREPTNDYVGATFDYYLGKWEMITCRPILSDDHRFIKKKEREKNMKKIEIERMI